MDFSIEEIMARNKEILRIADDLSVVRNRTRLSRDSFSTAWRSADVNPILWAMDELCEEIIKLEKEIEDIGHDIVSAGDEIIEEKENEERLAREKEEQEQREKERKEKERREKEEAERKRIEEENRKKEEEKKKQEEEIKKQAEKIKKMIIRSFKGRSI